MNRQWIKQLGLGLFVAIPVSVPVVAKENVKVHPNVIFILLDDYGYTDLGCYGSKFYETPNIDRLASEGVRFTNGYATCPVSSPSRSSIMTGKYPVRTGVTDWIPGRQAESGGLPQDKWLAEPFQTHMALEETTIAEALRANGYATMISGKWHLGETEQFWPEAQGFDVNKGGYNAGSPNKGKNSNGYFSPYGNPRLEDGPVGEYLTDRQTDEALKFIGSHQANPFYVYLSYYAVHNPMQGKEALIEKFKQKAISMGIADKERFTKDKDWIKQAPKGDFKERLIQNDPVYAAMIYSVDENIGRLLAFLKEKKLYDNTIIVFTSDNGGLSTAEGSPTTNAPLRAGKGWLYEGGIRVPLIIRIPDSKVKNVENNTPVCGIDFYPTLLDCAGISSDQMQVDGISLLPLLKNGKLSERPLFWHYPHYSNQGGDPGSAVRLGKYKLIDNFETGKQELYDLEKDISETTDLAESNPQKVKEFYKILNDWRLRNHAKMMTPNPNFKNE